MQVVYIFLRIVLASILIVVLFQVARGKFLADMEKEKTVKMVLKKLFSITLQVSLFWGIWFWNVANLCIINIRLLRKKYC